MKKRILLLSCVLLVSCQQITSTGGNKIDEQLLHDVINAKELTISETTFVDDKLINTKTGLYDNVDKLKSYAFVLNKDTYFYSSNPNGKTIEQFVLDNQYLISFSKAEYKYTCNNQSILAFKGLDSFFDKALSDNKSAGSMNITSCLDLARDTYYDLGYMVDYNSFIGSFDFNYKFYVNNEILSLEVDLTSVYKKLFPLIGKATKTYNFQFGYDKNIFVEYPRGEDEKPNNEELDEELKVTSSNYIKSIYSQLEYLSNSLSFLSRHPKSGRLTYAYSSSNTAILDNSGNFKAPSKDEEIELTISLMLDKVEFEKQTFKFIAHAPITRSGKLGTKENPIYQGRKEIDKVEIYFIEMHEQYGDSIFIKAGDFDMLIDAGQNMDGSYVVNFLREHCVDSNLDLLVATHAHSDHIGGMTSVINWAQHINYSLDYGYNRSNYSTASSVRNLMKNKSDYYTSVTDALKDKTIYISDDFYITILDTKQYIEPGVDIGNGDDNAASVTFIMTYKNHSYYFSGDLDELGETKVLSSNQLKNVDLMKATHHASYNGNSTKLLNTLKPKVVAISTALVERGSETSNSASQAHPNQGALTRFYNAGAKVYCNFTMGTIHVTSYGSGNLEVEGLGVNTPYYLNGKAITGEENKEFKDTAWAQQFRR